LLSPLTVSEYDGGGAASPPFDGLAALELAAGAAGGGGGAGLPAATGLLFGALEPYCLGCSCRT
jgi:hypothetical protein